MTTTPTLWTQTPPIRVFAFPGDDRLVVNATEDGGFQVTYRYEYLNADVPDAFSPVTLSFDLDGAFSSRFFHLGYSSFDSVGPTETLSLPDGRTIFSYHHLNGNKGLSFELLAPDLIPLGETVFDAIEIDDTPALTLLHTGQVALAYVSGVYTRSDLIGRIVAPDGSGGTPFTIAPADTLPSDPDAATLASGAYAVVYSIAQNSGDVVFSIRNASGSALAAGVLAGGVAAENSVVIAALGDGGFAAAWRAKEAGGPAHIRAAVIDGNGQPVVHQIEIATSQGTPFDEPAITALRDGGFFVVWVGAGAAGDLFGQRFDAAGHMVGDAAKLYSDGVISYPAITTLADGRITVSVMVDGEYLSTAIWDPRDDIIEGTSEADTMTSRIDGATLFGLGGNDRLLGSAVADTLIGGLGLDTLIGGDGNDTYVDIAGDVIVERSGGGTDTIESSGHASLSGIAHLENLKLTGSRNTNGSGNFADNVLTGNSGQNRLVGSLGDDTMIGGRGSDFLAGGEGNDIYVDPLGDTIFELAGQGIDTVQSSVNFVLSGIAHVEDVTLTGANNANAIGNYADNRLTGNGADNRLCGSLGYDTLDGRGGADTFVFGAVAESTSLDRDRTLNMNLDQDKFDFTVVPTSIGTTVTIGTLNVATFDADLAAAVDAGLAVNGVILFDPSAGNMNVAGQVYLVLDANADGAYTAGADYVIQMHYSTGTLSLDDFI